MLPVAQIRQAVDLFALVSRYTALKRTGRTAIGCCPLHREKTPSFRINLPGHAYENRWRCHGACGTGGDAIDFLSAVEQIPMAEAARRLAGEAGISLGNYRPETPAERHVRERAAREREFCRWWWRQRWKEVCGLLDLEMAELADEEWAGCLGRLLRWCERSWSTDEGITVFRGAVQSAERRLYSVVLAEPGKTQRWAERVGPLMAVSDHPWALTGGQGKE